MKRIILFAAALAAMVSCEQENRTAQQTEPEQGRREVTIVATASETKTTLSENAVLWEANDAVRLLFTPQTGTDLSVHTEEFTTAAGGETASFAGSIPNTVKYGDDAYCDDLLMVYPSTAMGDDGTVSFTLDAIRTVASGSFPSEHNLASARTSFQALDENGTADANFLNAFAIIRFKLPENVVSLKITGTSPLAGEASFDFNADHRLVADSWTSGGSNSVTLNPSGDSFDVNTDYNILVYPGTHSAITVELTDNDGCTYSNTVTKAYNFEAAKFYTFNFSNQFGQDFTFTVSGVDINGEGVTAVFTDGTTTFTKNPVVSDGTFTVKLLHGEDVTSGYAVYPSTAYDDGVINYTLPADGSTDLTPLYSASLSTSELSAAFNSVTSALATLKFTIPEGVSKTTVTSTAGFVGAAIMTVNSEGRLQVSGNPAGSVITLNQAGEYALYIYPLSSAKLTFEFTDSANMTDSQTFENVTVAAGATHTVDVNQNLEFEKTASARTEDFTSGGSYDF